MKKALIIFSSLIVIALALPIIGNSFMKNAIAKRISELESYGLKSSKSQRESSYFYTSEHIEFVLEDTAAFSELMQSYADSQVPAYVDAIFRGVTIGVDIKYSNLFFSKAITLELYPMHLSQELNSELQKKNLELYKYIKEFFEKKGLLYHIEYEVVSRDFHGFVKDIHEQYTLEDKSELFVSLEGVEYEGNGELIAPQRLQASLKKIDFQIIHNSEKVLLELYGLKSASSYDSKSTYVNSFEFDALKVEANSNVEHARLELQEMKFNSSSNTQAQTAELYAKSSLSELTLDAKNEYFNMKNFNLDTGIRELNKESFEELLELLSKIDTIEDAMLEQKIQQRLYSLLSEGFIFNVADFSAQEVSFKEGEYLGGLKLQSQIELKKDKNLAQKLQISPLLLVENIELETNLTLSEDIYKIVLEQSNGISLPQEYIIKEDENYIFNLRFKDGVSTMNGKVLQ